MSGIGRFLARRSVNKAIAESNNANQQNPESAIRTEDFGPRRIERDFNKPNLRPDAPAQLTPRTSPAAPAQTYVRTEPAQKKEPASVVKPHDVTIVPDSWELKRTRNSLEPAKNEEGEEVSPRRKRGPRRKDPSKVRRFTMTISVSHEESEAFHRHAGRKGLTFSEWARAVLLRSMNQPL